MSLYAEILRVVAVTKRLEINRFSALDLDAEYTSWFRSRADIRFLETVGIAESKESLADTFYHMERSKSGVLFAIRKRRGGKKIGTSRITKINDSSKEAWIGYLIGDLRERGQGLGAEAIEALSTSLLSETSLTRLFAGVNGENEESKSLAMKAGFRQVNVTQGQSMESRPKNIIFAKTAAKFA